MAAVCKSWCLLHDLMQDVLSGEEVTLSFADEDRPGYFAIVNADMELAELGWIKFPKLMHLGWAAQWLQYEARLKANLSRPALEVPVFKEEVRPYFLCCSHTVFMRRCLFCD